MSESTLTRPLPEPGATADVDPAAGPAGTAAEASPAGPSAASAAPAASAADPAGAPPVGASAEEAASERYGWVIVGLAFATPIFAFTAFVMNENAFSLIFRLGMIPLFLFSGAFFPITNPSAPMEWFARVTPLWHGVDLTRMLVLGRVDGSTAAVHVVYLVVLAAVGWWLTVRYLTRRLVES